MEPRSLTIFVEALAPTPGYTDFTIKPVTYIQRPPDGIYDVTSELSLTVNQVTLRGNPKDREAVVLEYKNQTEGKDAISVTSRSIASWLSAMAPGDQSVSGIGQLAEVRSPRRFRTLFLKTACFLK